MFIKENKLKISLALPFIGGAFKLLEILARELLTNREG